MQLTVKKVAVTVAAVFVADMAVDKFIRGKIDALNGKSYEPYVMTAIKGAIVAAAVVAIQDVAK